jgi:DNA-binding IclR family transcriptional regulator
MESPKGLKLVEKAVEVLDQLAQRGELSVAQLAEFTGEPRSSLYRLIATLETLRLVEPASSRGLIRLGTRLLSWGAATQSGLNVRDRALPVMQRINESCELTTYLLVQRDFHGVCIERLEGLRVSSLSLLLGGFISLHLGAAPRALLAFSDRAFWQTYADQQELESPTELPPLKPAQLFELLEAERGQGYTISDGDVSSGIASIGAPVYNHLGQVEAAISVSGIRQDVLGDTREEIIRLVTEGASEISAALGAPLARS